MSRPFLPSFWCLVFFSLSILLPLAFIPYGVDTVLSLPLMFEPVRHMSVQPIEEATEEFVVTGKEEDRRHQLTPSVGA